MRTFAGRALLTGLLVVGIGWLAWAVPSRAAAPSCTSLGTEVGRAIAKAAVCQRSSDCVVRRVGLCAVPGLHCYAAVINKARFGGVEAALARYQKGCHERSRCRCRTPEQAVCRAGRCVPRS